jgi:hypothetical protein
MNTRNSKRGRPSKGENGRKAAYLDIRLGAGEKQTFKDAAAQAGLNLSAWVRERLRASAHKELKGGRHPEQLLSAKFVRPSHIELSFADGLFGTWSFSGLDLDMSNMQVATIRASASGNAVEVKSKRHGDVQLDSSSLRAAIDPAYAATLEASFLALRGPLEAIKANATSIPRK